MSALPGVIGGKYRVVAQVGKGGMATVYSAIHVGTGQKVALKVMTVTAPDAELDGSSPGAGDGSLTRFAREARIAGNIETQHVARVFDAGVDLDHGPYIAMELLTGDDLKDLIRRLGPLRPDLALRIVAQACIGVGRAHSVGVVHRDVKASNLFLAEHEFGNRVVKVLDFGIAKGKLNDHVDAGESKTLTKTGAMLGSPHYMSPEQVLGTKALDHRSDIWSLGIVLYKCLSARTPFDDRDTVGQLIVSIVQGSPPSVQDFAPWVPPEVTAIVARALKSRPDERFQSAHEMADAIRLLLPNGGFEITPGMLTPMSDDERRDVRPRLSARIMIPDGADGRSLLKGKRPGEVANAAGPVSESDATIGSATASLRRPSAAPSSAGSRVGIAVFALAAAGVATWMLARPGQAEPAPTVASSIAPVASSPPSAPSVDAVPRHVEVRVQPPTATVAVDDVAEVVNDGAVDVAGVLGSVHTVRLRANGRETTVEVIVAEDGARPRVVAFPEPIGSPAAARRAAATAGGAPASGPGRAPSAPSAARPAARFDTQFE